METGGSVGGTIADINWILRRINAKTVVIPGHGPVADKAAHPTAALDAKWDRLGKGNGARRFVAEIHYSLRPHFPGT